MSKPARRQQQPQACRPLRCVPTPLPMTASDPWRPPPPGAYCIPAFSSCKPAQAAVQHCRSAAACRPPMWHAAIKSRQPSCLGGPTTATCTAGLHIHPASALLCAGTRRCLLQAIILITLPCGCYSLGPCLPANNSGRAPCCCMQALVAATRCRLLHGLHSSATQQYHLGRQPPLTCCTA